MNATISNYLHNVNRRYKTGISREHSYRGDLQSLLESLASGILVTNEPARVDCGAPDYILTRKNIPVGYIEAKDIGVDLNSKIYQEQFNRYRKSLPNLIITDYLDFHLYRDGDFATSISIGTIQKNRIIPQTDHFGQFQDLITDFSAYHEPTIKSAAKLSKMMAGKARLLATVIENALTEDEKTGNSLFEAANITLREQLAAFRNVLIHDITPKDFADIYAQTIAYGMFAARLNDPTLADFSRQEAAELIPKSNPFLRKLFQYIAGYDLDNRIKWIIDALADIFRATNVAELLKDFGIATQQNDPMIHFYETFLTEYDPKLRKSRGVFYTPEPVVNFIVRAVDDILKTEFNLPQGLADTSKTTIEVNTQTADKRSKTNYKRETKEVHKVQILDPAAGTGTFLAEIVNHIYNTNFKGQEGVWSQYVENHLIPRLHGFEILMASYTMAHLKLGMLLTETGYKPTKNQRLKIYLTNSLEEHHPDTGTLFAGWLSSEANEANHVKRDTPVMVVIGNPPYAVSSSNASIGIDGKKTWIGRLIDDYKKGLNEKKLNLDDDYIKFIRYGQHFIEKNGEGILAYISNNSFIDGVTHRQMRKHLLETFDAIRVLNLHGHSNIKETCPNGSKDENVFDIRQGVSINILIKTKSGKSKNQIKYFDFYGLRKSKYEKLFSNSLETIKWEKLKCSEPYYFFAPKDFELKEQYLSFCSIPDLMPLNSNGLETHKDSITIQFNEKKMEEVVNDFIGLSENEIKIKYQISKEGSEWKVTYAKNDILKNPDSVTTLIYRPFDVRYTAFTKNSKGFLARPRFNVLQHMKAEKNLALLTKRQARFDFSYSLIVDNICEACVFESAYAKNQVFPLYFYPETNNQQTIESKQPRIPNLNKEIVNTIAKTLRLTFTPEKEQTKGTFAPIDILDYIYAVLHNPTYREKYKEFLKIDFPRVPYPKDKETFWQLVKLGGELRQIHLMESPKVDQYITNYPIDGNNEVGKVKYENEKVWINESQYFDKVPQIAWEFYIGGYQPAQKWLKDRKGRTLSYEDILHYQKIIVALTETDRLMKEIDSIKIEKNDF